MASKPISRPIRDVIPPAPKPKPKLDIEALLTPEKRKDLREQAERNVLRDEILAAEEQYLAQQKVLIESQRHPEVQEEYRSITVDLPDYADRITLDGRVYMHGGQYRVRKSVFDAMMEIISRAFRHEDEVKNRRDSNAYRHERNLRISANEGVLRDSDGRPAVKF